MNLVSKKIKIEYIVYFLTAVLRILILLASAKFFDEKTFIQFNAYIAFVDLAVIIINATSLNYLMIYNNDRNSPMIGENIFSLFFLIPCFIFFKDNNLMILLLFLLVFFKLNINLCCRYLQVNNKIVQSLIYNFFGNSFWIIFAIIYYFFFKKINIETFFLLWNLTLFVTFIVYLLNYPLIFNFNLKMFLNFIKFYLKNFHFAFLFSSFLNVERLLYYKLFNSYTLLSTYTIFTKITSLVYELTYGFIIHKKVGKNFNINIFYAIPIIIILNIGVYILFNVGLINEFLRNFFSGKLYYEYYDLLPYILLSITFITFLRIFYIDLVKRKYFKKLFFIVSFIYLSFLIIIFFKLSIYNAILTETLFISIACIYSYRVIKNEN